MSFFSALFKWIKAVFAKVFDLLLKLFKAIWPILLIIAIIYFAPLAAAWLSSVGAPSFLVGAFEFIGAAAPFVESLVGAIGSGLSYVGTEAWSAFAAAEFGTQVAIVAGAGALIAPEETAAVVEEAVEAVVDVTTSVVSGLASSWGWLIAAGAGLYLLTRPRKEPNGQLS